MILCSKVRSRKNSINLEFHPIRGGVDIIRMVPRGWVKILIYLSSFLIITSPFFFNLENVNSAGVPRIDIALHEKTFNIVFENETPINIQIPGNVTVYPTDSPSFQKIIISIILNDHDIGLISDDPKIFEFDANVGGVGEFIINVTILPTVEALHHHPTVGGGYEYKPGIIHGNINPEKFDLYIEPFENGELIGPEEIDIHIGTQEIVDIVIKNQGNVYTSYFIHIKDWDSLYDIGLISNNIDDIEVELGILQEYTHSIDLSAKNNTKLNSYKLDIQLMNYEKNKIFDEISIIINILPSTSPVKDDIDDDIDNEVDDDAVVDVDDNNEEIIENDSSEKGGKMLDAITTILVLFGVFLLGLFLIIGFRMLPDWIIDFFS